MEEEFATVTMISTLNNRGVHQLLQGDCESSIATFRSLRAHIRVYARTISCKGRHCHHKTNLQSVEVQSPEVADNGSIFFPVVFCRSIDDDDDGDDELQDSWEPVQNLASNRCRLCQRSVCLQSAMSFHNLATAYHVRCWKRSQYRSSDSQMAIKFYRHAMTLTHTIQPNVNDGSGQLMVSLGNNLAFSLAEVCDFAAVDLCVAGTLAHFPRLCDIMGPFLSNAVIWRMLATQPSAAA